MQRNDLYASEFLTSADLAVLESVLSELCPESGISGPNERRSQLAAAAIELYQNGVMDHDDMVERLRGF